MNFPYFLAKRSLFTGRRTFSKLIVRVTIGALALAISAIILSVAILKGFKTEIIEKQRGFFGDIIITKNDLNASYENLPISLSSDDFNRLSEVPSIMDIAPFATKAGIMNVKGEVEGVLMKGIDRQYNQQYLQRNIIKGDTLNFSESAATQILISQYLANRLQLDVGDKFVMYFVQEPIRKRPFTVKGIYTTHSEELDKTYVIGSLDLIRRLNNLADSEVGAYQLRLSSFDSLAIATSQINNLLPAALNATNIVEQMPDIFNWLNMLDMNDNIIFVLMVVVAVINMISALLITILERSSMIGILKALGYTNGGIRRVFLYGSAYLIGIGLLIGNLLALCLYVFQTNTHFFRLDPATYYIEYVPMAISWPEVFFLNAAVAVIGLLTLFIPAMLVSRISPIKTIQFK
ncbi:lipoprotein-releasing system permease protein [Sphingobacterium allocomposti]|uniref:Lipoprotein-releasing system permease protein n=1 Tax=Sphingobacterium allocomposti TaxID=415956 RepID=A0A5S5DL93_9SPHI|nr:FtsX-like permease family protein [Sphingobacterium composti Yoo et al. 2007 non Ten et al. 2007]TYP96687.1 lipoprotein-releasing system permease protein [Sphingobacterium composti Yoo et al. 2007 non Ten et al. 2007]